MKVEHCWRTTKEVTIYCQERIVQRRIVKKNHWNFLGVLFEVLLGNWRRVETRESDAVFVVSFHLGVGQLWTLQSIWKSLIILKIIAQPHYSIFYDAGVLSPDPGLLLFNLRMEQLLHHKSWPKWCKPWLVTPRGLVLHRVRVWSEIMVCIIMVHHTLHAIPSHQHHICIDSMFIPRKPAQYWQKRLLHFYFLYFSLLMFVCSYLCTQVKRCLAKKVPPCLD